MYDPSIVEVSGDAAKMIALQFLGQNLGEMKELDKNIVSSLKPIAGSIDPHSLINSIPGSGQPLQQQQPVQVQPQVQFQAPQPQSIPQEVIPQLVPVQQSDPNQLELDFKVNPEKIFDKIDNLNHKLNNIIETQELILSEIKAIKKKLE